MSNFKTLSSLLVFYTPQRGIVLNDRLSGVLSLVPSSGIEKNAPLRGKALIKLRDHDNSI